MEYLFPCFHFQLMCVFDLKWVSYRQCKLDHVRYFLEISCSFQSAIDSIIKLSDIYVFYIHSASFCLLIEEFITFKVVTDKKGLLPILLFVFLYLKFHIFFVPQFLLYSLLLFDFFSLYHFDALLIAFPIYVFLVISSMATMGGYN